MSATAFRKHVEALAAGNIKDDNAPLVRALQKKEIRQCSQAWATFIRHCHGNGSDHRAALRKIAPTGSLPPVA